MLILARHVDAKVHVGEVKLGFPFMELLSPG